MARIFPLRSEPPTEEGPPRVVDLDGDEAERVFGALSSDTARNIYATIEEQPRTPSDVADAVDSSIQNVRYHLEKLEDAGLIEVVDTWYSSRGNEMDVYAAADGPLILTSDATRASRLRDALSRFAGAIAVLAGLSMFLQVAMTRSLPDLPFLGTPGEDAEDTDDVHLAGAEDEPDEEPMADDDVADDESDTEPDDAPDDADESPEEATEFDVEDDGLVSTRDAPAEEPEVYLFPPTETVETVFGTVPPGALFFLGGLIVLVAVFGYWHWRRPY